KVDVALVETGLGGRLDSTNVVQPLAAAVTSVGIDHVEYLGSTLEAIAREKAGIFKQGAGAVVGELDPAIRRLLVDAASDAGASSIYVLREQAKILDVSLSIDGTRCEIDVEGERGTLTTPLIGRHQAQNLVTALLT